MKYGLPSALLVTASGDPSKPAPDDPAGRARALQYDVALNGWELGGGSVRIWRTDLLTEIRQVIEKAATLVSVLCLQRRRSGSATTRYG